ncbi:hypothetical protein ACHQM5_019768 [Ranunculus cassubicifolius]
MATKLDDEKESSTLDFPAPQGWTKKVTLKKGGTPKRGAVVFISADGEEIKHKKALEKYLRAHHGNPPLSEFDWGTGDTPRRSSRLSGKSKATESPDSSEPATKHKKTSSSSKKGKSKDETQSSEAPSHNEEGEADDSRVDAEMKDAEPVESKDDFTSTTEEIVEAAIKTNEKHTVSEDQIMEDPCVVEDTNVESNYTTSTVEENKEIEIVPPVKEDDNKVPEEDVSVEVPKTIEKNPLVKEAALPDTTQVEEVKPVEESLPGDTTQAKDVKPVEENLSEDSTPAEKSNTLSESKPVEENLPVDNNSTESKPIKESLTEDSKPKDSETQHQSSNVSS